MKSSQILHILLESRKRARSDIEKSKAQQRQLTVEAEKVVSNIKKAPQERRSGEYYESKSQDLSALWKSFNDTENNVVIKDNRYNKPFTRSEENFNRGGQQSCLSKKNGCTNDSFVPLFEEFIGHRKKSTLSVLPVTIDTIENLWSQTRAMNDEIWQNEYNELDDLVQHNLIQLAVLVDEENAYEKSGL